MSDVAFRVLALEVHCFVDRLYPVGVGARVIRQLNLLADADALGLPVEVAHVHGTSDLSGDEVVASLPFFHGLSGAFRGDREVERVHLLHLLDEALDHRGGASPVNRDAAYLAEEHSDRPEEKLFFDHDVRGPVELCVEEVGDHKVPHGSVWHTENDAFAFRRGATYRGPAHLLQQPSAKFSPT